MSSAFASIVLALRRLAAMPATRLAWFSACALWITHDFFDGAAQLNEFRDAQVLFGYEDAAVRSVRQYGEWPLWDPYYCGGLYALGTPQARFPAPTFVLSLLFGALRAQPLIAFLLTFLGMEGFFRFARTRAASALGPALAAPIFAANGFLAYCYFGGWLNFYGFLLFPWVLYGVDRTARGAPDGALILAATFAFIVGFGGTYAGPMAALLALVHSARLLLESAQVRAEFLRVLGRLSLAAYLALLLSAFRMWPVVESLIAAPRIMAGRPEQSMASFVGRLFELGAPRGHNFSGTGQSYVGFAFLPLVMLGLGKRGLSALILVLLWLWTATGYTYAPYAPFAWLRELPVLSALRYPQRFLFPACLAATELAAFGFDRLVLALRGGRAARVLSALALPLALVLVGLTLRGQVQNMRLAAENMWLSPAPLEREQPFQQARGNRWLAAYFAPLNRGSIACWEAYPVPESPLLRGDLQAEEYLTDPAAGRVTREHWSPNRIDLRLHLAKPARLHVNQNYHPGWHASVGQVRSEDGLLAVDLPAGDHALRLRFVPRSALFGAGVSMLALGALLALLRRNSRVTAGFALAAPLLAGASFVVWDEPLPQAPPLLNADRSPVVIAEPARNAARFSASFDAPVTLEGAEIPAAPDAAGASDFALYLRVHGHVPRSVGLRIELESNLGGRRSLDRDVIGASVYLNDAPRGPLLRDAFSVALGPREQHERWKLYVSLRDPTRSPDRIPVRAVKNVTAEGARVLVSEF